MLRDMGKTFTPYICTHYTSHLYPHHLTLPLPLCKCPTVIRTIAGQGHTVRCSFDMFITVFILDSQSPGFSLFSFCARITTRFASDCNRINSPKTLYYYFNRTVCYNVVAAVHSCVNLKPPYNT